jgi:hypothetical protein
MRGPRGEGRARARALLAAAVASAVALLAASPAVADFPWPPPGGDYEYRDLRSGPGQVPDDLDPDDDNTWKYAATPDPANALINDETLNPDELSGPQPPGGRRPAGPT